MVAMRLGDMYVLVQALFLEFMLERCQHLICTVLPARRTRAAQNVTSNVVRTMRHTYFCINFPLIWLAKRPLSKAAR